MIYLSNGFSKISPFPLLLFFLYSTRKVTALETEARVISPDSRIDPFEFERDTWGFVEPNCDFVECSELEDINGPLNPLDQIGGDEEQRGSKEKRLKNLHVLGETQQGTFGRKARRAENDSYGEDTPRKIVRKKVKRAGDDPRVEDGRQNDSGAEETQQHSDPQPPWAPLQDKPEEFVQKWLSLATVTEREEYSFYRAINTGQQRIYKDAIPSKITNAERKLEFFFWLRNDLSSLNRLPQDILISKDFRKLFDINLHYIISPEMFYRLCSHEWSPYDAKRGRGQTPEVFDQRWKILLKVEAGSGNYRDILNDVTLNAYDADPRIAHLTVKVLLETLMAGGIQYYHGPTRRDPNAWAGFWPEWSSRDPVEWSERFDWSLMTRDEAIAVRALFSTQLQPKWIRLGVALDQRLQQSMRWLGGGQLLYLLWLDPWRGPYWDPSAAADWMEAGLDEAIANPNTQFRPFSSDDHKLRWRHAREIRAATQMVRTYEEAGQPQNADRARSKLETLKRKIALLGHSMEVNDQSDEVEAVESDARVP
ncbi:MAG: hypothetical protein M1831_002466 [Alyxoria varia]|nr:MAG: hypothetical protein M1831_002466 [Alyxoria varia]